MNELGNTPADKNYKPSGISRAEERAFEAYPIEICGYTVECRVGAKPEPQDWNEGRRKCFQEGYETAEKDLADVAAFSSGPDGFYYGRGYQQGKKDAEKDLALTPDDIKLITKIHYEIVFKDTTGIKIGDVASEVITRFKQIKEESHD